MRAHTHTHARMHAHTGRVAAVGNDRIVVHCSSTLYVTIVQLAQNNSANIWRWSLCVMVMQTKGNVVNYTEWVDHFH